ncbi:cytochrome P450 [Kitasatospora sp. NPDC002040]|uniref:cytochrome P450 n=1 Tax=Kitasatospora sp. NPDC002040 TaxID=3154661 RepID=UPI0033270B67
MRISNPKPTDRFRTTRETLRTAFRLSHDPLGFLRALPAGGGVVPVRLGPFEALVVTDPELTRTVLLDDRVYDKGGALYDRIREITGDGLVSCPHQQHRRQRRLLQPAFGRELTEGHVRTMSAQAGAAARSWSAAGPFDPLVELLALTTRTLVGTMLSDALTESRIRQAVEDYSTILKGLYAQAVLPSLLSRLPVPANLRHRRARARLRSTLAEVVAQRRADGRTDRADLLSALLPGPDAPGGPGEVPFTDAEICDQLVTFLIAGSETTAVVLAWAVHFLAADRQLQQRLQAEVDGLRLDGRPMDSGDVAALPLTTNTVTEALRIRPPGWIFSRLTTRPAMLGEYAVPAGTTVLYSPYLIHHRADLYPDPERFDPDRWAPDAPGRPQRSAFIPFGAGARRCIGERFGLAEAVVILATLVSRWQWEELPGSDARPVAAVSLRPRGLRVLLTERTEPIERAEPIEPIERAERTPGSVPAEGM